jgi:uncharacterized protein (DUF4415 family)
MSNAFNSIKRGLLEAIEHAEANSTTEVTLWLDAEVLDAFKATGLSWQTRINELLRDAVKHGLAKP